MQTRLGRKVEIGRPLVFDRVIIADIAAAINGKSWQRTQRTASEPFALPGSAHWWSTIRNSVIGLTYGYEVNVVSMDKLSRIEQLHLSGRTTVWMALSLLFSPF